MRLWPTHHEWRRWTLPSQASYVGAIVGILGLGLSVALSLAPPDPGVEEAVGATAPTSSESPTSSIHEHIFGNQYYYLQVLTDQTDRVVAYGVTTRRADFNPEFMMHRQLVRLGSTSFGEIAAEPSNVFGYLGANRFTYHEEYYFGNPTNYQTFFLGINDSGYIEMGEASRFFNRDVISTRDSAVEAFRAESKINTFFVSDSLEWSLDDMLRGYFVGPETSQVRVLPEVAIATRAEPKELLSSFEALSTQVTLKYYVTRFGEPLVSNRSSQSSRMRTDFRSAIWRRQQGERR